MTPIDVPGTPVSPIGAVPLQYSAGGSGDTLVYVKTRLVREAAGIITTTNNALRDAHESLRSEVNSVLSDGEIEGEAILDEIRDQFGAVDISMQTLQVDLESMSSMLSQVADIFHGVDSAGKESG